MADCEYEFSIEVEDTATITVVEVPGIQGPPGIAMSGVSYIQDSAPVSGDERNLWWNNLTGQIKVRHNDIWNPIATDGGHF